MPIDVFLGAAIINRRIAVPVLALMATGYHQDAALGREDTGFFLYACLYGFVGCFLRHYLQQEIVETIRDRRENIRLAAEREQDAARTWPAQRQGKADPE